MKFVLSYGTLDIVIIYIYYTRNNFSMAFPNIVAGPSHEKIREETLISNGRVKVVALFRTDIFQIKLFTFIYSETDSDTS